MPNTIKSPQLKSPGPVVIGIRHHSPACARLVQRKIRDLRPAFVLIEGPADFNGRLAELYLQHEPPLAIYSYLSASEVYRASWTPFLTYSPEWQGLLAAREVGAEVRFIDLPAWHEAMGDLSNRYADVFDSEEGRLAARYEEALCAELHLPGLDALWDHLFENESNLDRLEKTLDCHFDFLRGEDPGSAGNQSREEMMSAWLAWALAQDRGGVLVICGGYHAKAIRDGWPRFTYQRGDEPPPTPKPVFNLTAEDDHGHQASAGSPLALQPQFGSYLVPYSFKRLDSFQGYASGMPSPAYYQWLWEEGLEKSGLKALELIFRRLREKKYAASTADLKAVHAAAAALAAWRGHRQPLRSDYLDAVAGGLIKTALETPPPWDYRGPIRPGTDPVLVEVMTVMAGDKNGRLAPDTPQPPLVLSARQELENLGLDRQAGPLKIDLLDQRDISRSRCLHTLLILAIPGFERSAGPDLALGGAKNEVWHLSQPLEQQAALIEAGIWGATLASAAQNRIEAQLREAQGQIAVLARILNQAAWAGLSGLSGRTLEILRQSVANEAHFEAFGEALAILFPLWLHGRSLNMQHAPVLKVILEAAFDRMLWLLEPPVDLPTERFQAHLHTQIELVRLVREALAQGANGEMDHTAAPPQASARLDIEPERALAVWSRKAADPEAAPVSRGAALGALLTLRGREHLAAADQLLADLPSAIMGDALMGLLALGREVLAGEEAFLKSLDQRIQSFSPAEFTQALPSLRAAFGWLPSRERQGLAQVLVKLHQGGSVFSLTQKLASDPLSVAQALETEQKIVAELARWGIFLTEDD